VQPDPEPDPALRRDLLVGGRDPYPDAEGALQRVHGARELGQNAVAGRVGDPAAVPGDEPVRDVAMGGEEPQGADLVRLHEPRVARDIGAEHRGKAPGGWGVGGHGGVEGEGDVPRCFDRPSCTNPPGAVTGGSGDPVWVRGRRSPWNALMGR
jgi:hypothetical protein